MSTADTLAATVVELRPVADDLALPDFCAVKRKGAATIDSRGNKTYAETTLATVRGRLRSGPNVRPQERVVADQAEAVAPYAIDLPYGTSVTAQDAITVNTTRRFEVIGVLTDGGYGVFTVAIVEKRT